MRGLIVGILLAAVAGASVGTWLLVRHRDAQLAAARDRSASGLADSVHERLRQREQLLSQAVELLTSNTTLRQVVVTDEKTVKDQIEEEGLRNLRVHEAYAIGRVVEQAGTHIELLASKGLPGITGDKLQLLPPVQKILTAEEATPTTGAVLEGAEPFLFAVAPFSSLDKSTRGVVLIGESLGAGVLGELAAKTGATLVLSDGHRAVVGAGDAELQRLLDAAVGKEAQFEARSYTDAAWRVTGRAVPVAAQASLWVGTSMSADVDLIQSSFSFNVTTLWSAVLGAALIVSLVLWRRKKPAAALSAPTPLESWAGTAPGMTPPSTTIVPVLLPNGQVGQLITGPNVPLNGATPIPIATAPGMTQPHFEGGANMFGRYKLLDRLGSGGMAEVWTAVVTGAEGFRRPFVVKRMRRDIATNADLVQSFIDEANLAAQLVHSNIVPVFDFGNLNGEYYIAQEYILGRDLGKITTALAQRGQRLPPELALYITCEILKALDYAHTLTDKTGQPLGIVHRDISPNNILCSMRGEVKLIDFGIAKSTSKVGQTEVGTVKGNLRFMSPEQAQGVPVDARSDIFSLAMSVYFTQSGESLYTATSPYDLLMAAARGPEAADLAKVANVASPLRELLQPALQPHPESRFQSAQHFLEHVLPITPVDGSRRLAALISELFGTELRQQEAQFASAVTGEPIAELATVQSIPTRLKTGQT